MPINICGTLILPRNIIMNKLAIVLSSLLSLLYASRLDSASCRKGADACCPAVEVANWNFDDLCPILSGPGANWFQFGLGAFTANDGTLTCSPRGGLLLSNPFTLAYLPGPVPQLDQPKWLAYDATPKDVPVGGKLIVEWVMSLTAFNTAPNPFPEGVLQGETDIRLATGGANTIDLANSLTFDMFMTNDRVYAVYERLPFTRGTQGDYAAFTFVVPIAKRRPSDLHLLQLVLDDAAKTVTYNVDRRHGLTIRTVGFPLPNQYPVGDLGGTPASVFPTSLTVGFGSFALLGLYPASTRVKACGQPAGACDYPPIREALVDAGDETALPMYNPVLGAPNAASYWDGLGTDLDNHVWGQGVEIHIRSLRAYTKAC